MPPQQRGLKNQGIITPKLAPMKLAYVLEREEKVFNGVTSPDVVEVVKWSPIKIIISNNCPHL